MTPARHLTHFSFICLGLSCTVLLLTAAPARAGQKPAAPSQDPLVRMNESMDALTRKVWPSVVQIQVSGYGQREYGERGETSAVVSVKARTGQAIESTSAMFNAWRSELWKQ